MKLTNRQKFWILCTCSLIIFVLVIWLIFFNKEEWLCKKWTSQVIEYHENWNIKYLWCISQNWFKIWPWYYFREDSSLEKKWTYFNDMEEWSWYSYLGDWETIAMVEDFKEGLRDWKSIAYSDFKNGKKLREFSYENWLLSWYFADYFENWKIKKEWYFWVLDVNWRLQWKYNGEIKYYKENWDIENIEYYNLWELIKLSE